MFNNTNPFEEENLSHYYKILEAENVDVSLLHSVKQAACSNNCDVIMEYIKWQGRLNSCDTEGNTALHYACIHESVETVALLIQQPFINMEVQNFNGETPLHLAAMHNNTLAIIKLLLKAKCDVNIKNHCGETALHSVVRHKDHQNYALKVEMAKLILKNGFNLKNCKDNFLILILDPGVSAVPLDYRFNNNYPETKDYLSFFRMFLELRVDLAALNEPEELSGMSYFGSVLQMSAFNLADFLIEYMDDFNYICKCYFGENSYLTLAIITEYPGIMKMIEKGADINYRNKVKDCLQDSLLISSNWLFKYFWEHCDKEELFKHQDYTIFTKVLTSGQEFSKQEYLESLYLVLDSKYASRLIEKTIKDKVKIFKTLVLKFRFFIFTKNERLKLMYTILNINNNVSLEDLSSVFESFGFQEEFEVFLKTTVHIYDFRAVLGLVHYICYPHVPLKLHAPSNSPVLSLLESCRNVIRRNIKPVRRVKSERIYFEYYNKVLSLEIPEKLKEIIVLKEFPNR